MALVSLVRNGLFPETKVETETPNRHSDSLSSTLEPAYVVLSHYGRDKLTIVCSPLSIHIANGSAYRFVICGLELGYTKLDEHIHKRWVC